MSDNAWKIEHFANLQTAEVPDHRTRLYRYNRRIRLLHGMDTILVRFVLVVHLGKHDTVFEIFHSGVENNDTVWTPVSPSTFLKLFKKDDGSWFFGTRWTHAWTSDAEVILKDDRVLMKFSKSCIRKRVWGINLATIASTLPAFLVSEVGKFIAMVEKYPGIPSMDTAEIAWNAFDDYHSTEWEIRDGYFEKQRENILKNINEAQENIESCEKNIQNICDDAADAMNLLSEKYGIEVSL